MEETSLSGIVAAPFRATEERLGVSTVLGETPRSLPLHKQPMISAESEMLAVNLTLSR